MCTCIKDGNIKNIALTIHGTKYIENMLSENLQPLKSYFNRYQVLQIILVFSKLVFEESKHFRHSWKRCQSKQPTTAVSLTFLHESICKLCHIIIKFITIDSNLRLTAVSTFKVYSQEKEQCLHTISCMYTACNL